MVDVSKKARLHWHGKWIWADYGTPRRGVNVDQPREYREFSQDELNIFILIRHRFVVKGGLQHATINITADSRYKLFINGKYVGRGINRCESYYWYYNTFGLTQSLQEGENLVAIHARYYGLDFAYYTRPGGRGRNKNNSGKGGNLFDVELAYKDGTTDHFGSGEVSKVIRNAGERSNVPLKNDSLGFIEEFDSRQVPRDWNELRFDDTTWKKPVILDYPIKTLLLDENHPLREEFMYPSAILGIGENRDVNLDLDDEDRQSADFCVQHMLEGPRDPLASFDIVNVEALLGNEGICEIIPKSGSETKVLSIFLRFAKEMVGYPQLLVEGPAGTTIDIIPTEKMRDQLPHLSFMDQKRGSRLILRGGKQFFEQWDWEGYCFMLLKVRHLTGSLKIQRVGTNVTHMQLSRQGRFECSDAGLTRLWEACAHTLRCCAIDGYLDCPSREQRSYVGDAYPEALISYACFGEPRLTKKLIYDCAFGQRKDGITYSFHPGDYEIQTHIIPDYCLYWIQLTADYYQYYGDEDALGDLYPHFLRAMDWFWAYLDPATGLLMDLPYWSFIDWSFPHDKPGTWAILNTQFMDVLSFLVSLADKFSDTKNARRFRDKVNQLRPQIDKIFWDEQQGCYRDFAYQGALHGISYMTNAYLVLKGVTTDQQRIQKVIRRVFEFPGVAANDKAQIDDYYTKQQSHHSFGEDLKDRVVVAQPFFMHHVNQFFAKMCRYDLMAKYLRKWVPMLDIGPTQTIWETWSNAGSECHAWAATPAYDLSTHVLGVKPASPGFANIEISPHYMDLTWAKGSFPTCRGDVAVEWTLSANNEAKFRIVLPRSVENGKFIPPNLNDKKPCAIQIKGTKVDSQLKSHALQPGKTDILLQY